MKTFDKTFWIIFIPFLLLIGLICFFPYWVTNFNWHNIDFNQTGQIGDTIGGIMTPFIALAAAILTFFAFWVQFKANEQQRRDIQIERFETKYYELIHLQRENVSEIKIRNKHEGRKAFVAMYNEFRFCFYVVKNFISQYPNGTSEKDLGFDRNDDEAIVKIAYLVFFHGTGDQSDRLLLEPLQEMTTPFFYSSLLKAIKTKQKEYKEHKNENDWCLMKLELPNGEIHDYEATYKPFDGHISRLGHYYRHLFQSVKYVAEYNKVDFDFADRYEYLKTLRAQLSSHEQILLYYNTLTSLGEKWLDSKHPYLTRYKMIKNLPLPLADFGIKPEEKFKNEIAELRKKEEELFEWHE
jgi:hypothetical protein